MKKLYIYIAAGFITLTSITACKKIDNLHPYDSVSTSKAFNTIADAAAFDVGNYAAFRGVQYGQFMVSTDIQADQLNASLDYGNRNGSLHRWGTFFTSDDYTISGVWSAYYSAIANVNVAIAGFKKITPASAAETAMLNQYTGDLYLSRAFYYHNLILRFAKPYEPATASTDPGVPLITNFDLYGQPGRASVKQIYDQIISDITTAKGLLANVVGKQGAQTFTIDVATALEARVRLHMHDWAGAYTAASTLITAGKYPLITKLADLQNYWTTDGVQESIYQSFASTSQLPNNNNVYLQLNASTTHFDPDFIPSKWVVDMYDVADIRRNTYFTLQTATIQGVNYNLYLVNKYPGNPALFTGATSNYENAPKVFRIAEMYLIAAEAAANNSDGGNALIALNALRNARGITTLSGLSSTDLVQAIRDERFRELAFEGFRLDDLKRWHLGFTRHDPQDLGAIQNGSVYNTLSVPSDNDKFVWGLPANDITINPNLKPQNPGW